nr:hypothetical protein [Tanacetum cinerariifolium]
MKTPLVLPWERITRLDSGVRALDSRNLRRKARLLIRAYQISSTDSNKWDTVQLETAVNTISHEYLLDFTSEYDIPETLHPALHGLEDRIVDFPEDWRANAPKDGMSAEGTYSIEAVRALDTHRTPIQKQPEMLLCLVGISRRYYLGDEVTNCRSLTADMDLFNLIRAPNPTKVPLLTLTAPCVIEMDEPAATDSSDVPSTIERSPLDFAHEAGASDQGAAAPEMPSSDDVLATAAPGVGQAEETAMMDPSAAPESRKRGHDGTDVNAPPKSLQRDHADPRSSGSSHEGKSLAAIQLGLASTVVVPKDSPMGVSDPDPLSFTDAPSRHPVYVAQSSPGIAAVGDPESENASSPAAIGSSGSEEKLLRKSVAQVAPRDKRTEALELEIRNLEASLEAEANAKRAAKDKSAGLSQELERMQKLKAAFEEFKREQDERVEQRCVEMDARLDALSLDFDEELYPHMITTIAGHRWLIGHGLRLAVMKCGESLELGCALPQCDF